MGTRRLLRLLFRTTYTLTVNFVGSGSVTREQDWSLQFWRCCFFDCSAVSGWSFSGWSGDLSGSVNPMAILLDGNKTVTATFVQNTYTLTVNSVGSGSVTREQDWSLQFWRCGSFDCLSGSGWSLRGWSGDLSGSVNPMAILLDGNKTVTATFVQNYVYFDG